MNIKYKIIEIHPQDRTMVVRYFTDLITEKELEVVENKENPNSPLRCKTDTSLGIPLPEPTEEQLHKYILSYVPMAPLKILEELKSRPLSTQLDIVNKFKDITYSATEEEYKKAVTPTPKTEVISNEDLMKIVEQIK